MVDLGECFEPVADELAALERSIQAHLVTDSPAVQDLVKHISGYAGKRLRPGLVFLSAKAAGGEIRPEHQDLAVIVELIHTATLVHDDILDHASVRRRVTTVNAMHGNHVPVLLGDFIYARAFAMSVDLPTPDASRVLARVTQVVCQGEIEQIFDRFDLDLSEKNYLGFIEAKTAVLYAAACELGAMYSGASPDLVRVMSQFGRKIGTAFQIIDDCLDLIGDEEVVGKSLGTDLECGKLTLPLIRLVSTLDNEDRERLRSVILDDGIEDRRARLREEFDLGPSLDESFQCADDYIRDALTDLEVLPDTSAREGLKGVAEFVLCRKR